MTTMSFEGSASLMEKLHRDHGHRVRSYLARLVGAADAEDLAQDVFEKAQRAIGTFRGEARLRTWLYRVATNVAIDRLRTAARRADLDRDRDVADALEADGAESGTDEGSPDVELDRSRMRECILRVVEQLPQSHRAAILLGELRGFSDREMAEALGISVGAAKIRLHRGRQALKMMLERECSFQRDERNEFSCAPKVGGLVQLARSR
jgi:RNA polymerase sigma-70 factor (ECF subfamily)